MEHMPPRERYLSSATACVTSFNLAKEDKFSPAYTYIVSVRRSLMYLLVFYSSTRMLQYSSTSLLAREYRSSITPTDTRKFPSCRQGDPSFSLP